MKGNTKETVIISILISAFMLFGGVFSANAQHGYRVTKRVNFKKGEIATSVAGSIPSALENHEYIVRVREGQTIRLNLQANSWYFGFYIMTSSDAMVEEEPFLKNYTGELSESGDYHVFVYTRKRAGRYRLNIQVASDI
jgi:hypothetical protein